MEILNTINNINISGTLSSIKVLSLILVILFIGGIIASLIGLFYVGEENGTKFNNHFNRNTHSLEKNPREERWLGIEAMFKSADKNAWRLAIIDADTMLEELIISMGYRGNTFGERLKDMHRNNIPWLQSAWDVHLLRNKLAHEGSRYPLNDREAYRAYRIYQQILVQSGYLA
jgi:hypothetical protein